MKAMKAKRTTTKKAMKATKARKRKKKAKTPQNKFEMVETFWPTVGNNGWFLVALENKKGWVKEIWLRECKG